MRDTSAWSGDFRASKPVTSITVRGRYPGFRWHDGEGTFYSIQALGETWGDSPGTVIERRERGLPTRYRYGGFVVAGDSLTLSSGNILRVTSLCAGDQGETTWYKEVSQPAHLTSMVTSLTYANPPRPWTGVGLSEHTNPVSANLFFIRGTDNRLCYRTYTSGSGWTGAVLYSGSPVWNLDGVGIAPISHAEGYLYVYDPASHLAVLHHFDGGVWTQQAMPMRYPQHPLNGHWFDAVAIGSDRLVTFCVNGVQYATWHTPGVGFRDPWRVMAFDPEFGGAQTRICKLTTVGVRIVATAWSRFAGSSDDYEVSYTHLLWSDDGVNWAMPEEGYVGQTACRGKLHTVGDTAYLIGASVSYVGDAVAWLGGSAQTQTLIAANVTGQNLAQDLDRASDLKLPLLIADSFDKSLLQYGNEVIYRLAPQGQPAVDMAHLTLDTPGTTLDGVSQSMQMVSRGPLKKLIGFTAPLDRAVGGPQISYQDFRQGGVYARWGVWNTDPQGFAFCDRYDDSNALATVGVQYGGPFQLLTRVRLTRHVGNNIAGVVFWYEGPEDYYRVDLTADAVYLRKIVAGQRSDLATAAFTLTADAWYHVLIQYFRGGLRVHVRPQGSSWSEVLTFANWSDPEPLRWYAGLFCSLPRTVTTQTVELDATHKVAVAATHRFPPAGEILLDSEVIGYATTTGTQFGSGQPHSVVRGVRSQRASHPEGAPVYLDGCRFEADRFGVVEASRPMSIADACAQVVTTTGVPFTSVQIVDDSAAGARVFPRAHGHGWVVSGEYSGAFKLQFWCNTTAPPQSGVELELSATDMFLRDLVSGKTGHQPVSIPPSGSFQALATREAVLVWINGRYIGGLYLDMTYRDFRIGALACDGGVTRLVVDELHEPAEGVLWAMRESARDVLARLLEGRDASLRERADGTIQVTLLEKRDDLGTLTGEYLVTYGQGAADEEWASALVAWGAEEWVLVTEPTADRLRWAEWQAPHITDRATLRHRAVQRLRKLWARKDLRTFQGPLDPRIEVGDELTIADIRGIPAGRYLVRSLEILGEPSLLDMRVTVQALPADVPAAVWPIRPGVDRPTGE